MSGWPRHTRPQSQTETHTTMSAAPATGDDFSPRLVDLLSKYTRPCGKAAAVFVHGRNYVRRERDTRQRVHGDGRTDEAHSLRDLSYGCVPVSGLVLGGLQLLDERCR
jgi:hypothetical protein